MAFLEIIKLTLPYLIREEFPREIYRGLVQESLHGDNFRGDVRKGNLRCEFGGIVRGENERANLSIGKCPEPG